MDHSPEKTLPDEPMHQPQPLSSEQVDTLRHACLNQRFMADPTDQDCIELHRLGLFSFAGAISWCDGGHLYYPTSQGRQLISNIDRAQVRVKLTRSQKRYLDFLKDGSDLKFGEWLRRKRVK